MEDQDITAATRLTQFLRRFNRSWESAVLSAPRSDRQIPVIHQAVQGLRGVLIKLAEHWRRYQVDQIFMLRAVVYFVVCQGHSVARSPCAGRMASMPQEA